MGKFQTLGIEELERVSLKISWRPGTAKNWKHTEINTLPELNYEYKDTDSRFAGKSEELRLYRNAYWDAEFDSGVTHREQYERDLREAVQNAIYSVNEQWNTIIAKELERDFK